MKAEEGGSKVIDMFLENNLLNVWTTTYDFFIMVRLSVHAGTKQYAEPVDARILFGLGINAAKK